MKRKHYLPKSDLKKLSWLQNFITKLVPLAATFGITPAELLALGNDLANLTYFLSAIDILKKEVQERVRYKDLLINGSSGISLGVIPSLPAMPAEPTPVQAGIFTRVTMLVHRIKNHSAYNESIGRDLGIIGAEQVLSLTEVKPVISKIVVLPDRAEIYFVKGQLQSVEVYCLIESDDKSASIAKAVSVRAIVEVESQPLWEKIGIASRSPFIDRRLNKELKPEARLYMLRYLNNDEPVGFYSDISRVIVEIGY